MLSLKDLKPTPLAWILMILIAVLVTYFVPFFLQEHSSYKAIDHQMGTTHTLTVDGSRRSIISKEGFACAEPSPDAMASMATQLATGFSEGDGDNGVSSFLKIASDPRAQALFRRTQGIQAIRDGMFRLCEARMNTAVSEGFYEEQMTDLLMTLNFIVPLELCINASTKMGELFGNVMADAAEADTVSQTNAELISNYMLVCLDISKDYGLTLAANAAATREARRTLAYNLKVEEKKLQAFTASQETAASME